MKSDAPIPAHVAIIMDGNGRWAKKRLLPRKFGHREGVNTLIRIVRHAVNAGVEYITVFALSTENRSRPKDELDSLMDLIRTHFATTFRELAAEGVRVRVLGDTSVFPADIREILDSVEKESLTRRRATFSVALNYGSRDEIVRAVNRAVESGQKVDEESFSRLLFTADMPDPDIILRTGGEKRLSNFLLYQAEYAELFFSDTLWPDFTEGEFDEILAQYALRDRRYGKVK